MASVASEAATAPMAADANAPPVVAKPPQKLLGRAFYESIGSPKAIVAPMVDQSEFVSHNKNSCIVMDEKPVVAC